jgi:exopolysaccharide production protein ExoQ
MRQSVVLFLHLGFIFWMLRRDLKLRSQQVSSGSWIVLIWLLIIAARPVSTWFGIEAATQSQAEAYDQGSPFERSVFLVLIATGIGLLLNRGTNLRSFAVKNQCLIWFYAYCGLSVLWSDYPVIAFKRWFKDAGNIVMVLVLLSERDPVEAIRSVFRRCAFVLVPLSLLFIKYFPELGRAYTEYYPFDVMYVGVATHKNTLGSLLLVSILFLVWDMFDMWRGKQWRQDKARFMGYAVLLLMSFWLLRLANSATSLVCTVLGITVFFVVKWAVARKRVRRLEAYAFVGVCLLIALQLTFDLQSRLLAALGRDPTLTGRTDAWEFLLSQKENALLGAGFNTFWAGERLQKLWQNTDMVAIIQAHNGYVETYLNIGSIGVVLLVLLLLRTGQRVRGSLLQGIDYSVFRFALLTVCVVYNFTEANFLKVSLLWFALLTIIVEPPKPGAKLPQAAAHGFDSRFHPKQALRLADG